MLGAYRAASAAFDCVGRESFGGLGLAPALCAGGSQELGTISRAPERRRRGARDGPVLDAVRKARGGGNWRLVVICRSHTTSSASRRERARVGKRRRHPAWGRPSIQWLTLPPAAV